MNPETVISSESEVIQGSKILTKHHVAKNVVAVF